MQCLDDRETQMGEDTIFVRYGQIVLQVGNNRAVMFYSDYKSSVASQRPLLLLLRTATHVLLPLTQSNVKIIQIRLFDPFYVSLALNKLSRAFKMISPRAVLLELCLYGLSLILLKGN